MKAEIAYFDDWEVDISMLEKHFDAECKVAKQQSVEEEEEEEEGKGCYVTSLESLEFAIESLLDFPLLLVQHLLVKNLLGS